MASAVDASVRRIAATTVVPSVVILPLPVILRVAPLATVKMPLPLLAKEVVAAEIVYPLVLRLTILVIETASDIIMSLFNVQFASVVDWVRQVFRALSVVILFSV